MRCTGSPTLGRQIEYQRRIRGGRRPVIIAIMIMINEELIGFTPQQRLVTEMSSRGEVFLEGNVTANFGAPFLI